MSDTRKNDNKYIGAHDMPCRGAECTPEADKVTEMKNVGGDI
jgi:hypothetical protein